MGDAAIPRVDTRNLALGVLVALLTANAASAASPLADAAASGDADRIHAMIAAGEDVNQTANDGATALLWATYYQDTELVGALLDAGADPNIGNDYGITPLLQASSTGDAAIVSALLDAGADPSITHTEGQTALLAAARTGSGETVRLLLDHGVDPDQADDYQQQTPLMWAAAEGHLNVVSALLDAGANPDLQAGVSSLSEHKNADYPTGGFTALMFATRNGHHDVVRRLVEGGSDLNMTNGDGATAMMIAIVNDRFDLAAELLSLGADANDGSLYHAVEMRDATTDWYARDGSRLRADHRNENSALDLIALLLDAGADPDKVRVGQMHSFSLCCDAYANGSAMYRAAVAADVEALKLLIAHGADVEASPSRVEEAGPAANQNVGKAPLLAAMAGGKGVPLSAGPGFNREGAPPFREASNRSPVDAMRVLLEAGANPDVLTPDRNKGLLDGIDFVWGGETALHDAARTRRIDVIRLLAEFGATLDLPDRNGMTALDIAENPLPDDPPNPFGPERGIYGDATDAEVAAVLRELIDAADGRVASAEPGAAR